MFYKKERASAAALSSLMAQTKDSMVCFTFRVPVNPDEPQDVIDAKLRDATIVEASRPFARYFGFERREDVLGKHLLDLFRGTIPDWFIDYGQEVEDRNFEDIERNIRIPIGDELRPMRIYMQNIFAGDLLVSQWITIRDMSRQERDRQAIEENERIKLLALEAVGLQTFSARFDAADEDHPYGVVVVGDEPHGDWWNRIYPEDRPQLEQAIVDFSNGKTDRLHARFRVVSEAGENVWMESWAVASEPNGQGGPKGLLGVVMDRTQSKALEDKLIASQRLESLGVLAGGIAHDFNNLLMSVVGAVDVISYSHPELKDALQVVDDAARQGSQLCDQLMTYAGRGSVELAPTDLSATLQSMRELLGMSVQKNATLSFEFAPGGWVRGETSQLSQVAMNLVKNASDALEGAPGDITVRLSSSRFEHWWPSEFHLGAQLEPGEYLALEVADTGRGMSEEELERLFDPFYTTKFTGRGLGLAVVMGAVRGHGGAIRVVSELGKGTRVTVVIPKVAAPGETPSAERPTPGASLAGSVLVVDDEESVRVAASNLLTAMGIESVVASGGKNALALLGGTTAQSFDAILLDVTMPDMDGVETAGRILERFPESNIIMCSGYSSVAMPEKLSAEVGFLQKPYRMEQLHDKLAPLLVDRRG